MEKVDEELLAKLSTSNYQLRKLYDEHIQLEKELAEYQSRPAYHPSERLKEQSLKKQKLHGMDSILAILNDYRKNESQVAA